MTYRQHGCAASTKIILTGRTVEALSNNAECSSSIICDTLLKSDVSQKVKAKVNTNGIGILCSVLERRGVLGKRTVNGVTLWKLKSVGTIGRA